MNQDIKDRIFAAADELFAASTTGDFPNVEAVRQKSRANMNYVVEALKEWRQRQRQTVQAVREPLPDSLQDAALTMGQSIWETAQRLANESLDAARAAFEAEKADLAKLSAEQSEAFESLRAELEAIQAKCSELETVAQGAQREAADLREQLAAMTERTATAEARAVEIEKRADDLKAELGRAHNEADAERRRYGEEAARLNAALSVAQDATKATTAEADRLRSDLAGIKAKAEAEQERNAEDRKRTAQETHRTVERMTKAEGDRDDARKEAGTAREEAAKLRGELDATKTQNAALLAALKPGADKPGKKGA